MGRTTLSTCDGLGHWLKVGRCFKRMVKFFIRMRSQQLVPVCVV
jgi:hypothetical protein